MGCGASHAPPPAGPGGAAQEEAQKSARKSQVQPWQMQTRAPAAERADPACTAPAAAPARPEQSPGATQSLPPELRGVSLRWLLGWARALAGTRHSFEATAFLAPRDGGGKPDCALVVRAEGLGEHLAARLRAERDLDGVATRVRFEGVPFEALQTTHVVDALLRPAGERAGERGGESGAFALCEVPSEQVAPPTHFVSHAWGGTFASVVHALERYFRAAAADSVYVWLDVFAIDQRQDKAYPELDAGRMLAKVISRSEATLVVAEKDLLPLRRLWCLYELGSTPADKVQLLTLGLKDEDIVRATAVIDAEQALCFSPKDERLIHGHIRERHGSLQAFSETLRLRLLLRPTEYRADMDALRRRSAGQRFDFGDLRRFLRGNDGSGAARVAVVAGGAGTGKSTIASALLEAGGGASAAHFCKSSDARRQDPLLMAHSLAYQLALALPAARAHVLGLSHAEALAARSDAGAAVESLLVAGIRALPAGERAVLLIDALDEGAVGLKNTAVSLIGTLLKSELGGRLSLVVTARPEVVPRLTVVASSAGALLETFAPAQVRVGMAGETGGAEELRAALERHADSCIFRVLATDLVKRGLRVPADVADAYSAYFEATIVDGGVRELIGVLAAAREPLSDAQLEDMGLLQYFDALPGASLLFERRELRVQPLHLSLLEWLRETREGDVAAGHCALASSCARWLEGLVGAGSTAAPARSGGVGPTERYALAHGHVHLGLGGDGLGVAGRVWFELLLEERGAGVGGAAPHAVSELSATEACGRWLLAQARAGRSKALAAELRALRDALGEEGDAGALRSLAAVTAVGVGETFAPMYNRGEARARQRFLAAEVATREWWASRGQKAVWGGEKVDSSLFRLEHTLPPRITPGVLEFITVGHSGEVTSVCFSPDGRRLASGSVDETVRVWDAATGESLATLEGHSGEVTSVFFSPDGRRLASGSDDATVRVWDAATGESLATLEGHSGEVSSMCYSPDGRRLASGSNDATVRVWDAATGESLVTLEEHSGWVTSVCFSPDGRRLASGSRDETVRVWDAATGESLATLEGHSDEVTSISISGWVSSVCFSPDGRRLASGSNDITVRVWDAATGESLATLEGHSGRVSSVCFSPDGRRLASGSDDKTVRVWDAATCESLATLEGHSHKVTSVCFSPDGRRLASGSNDDTVRVWDAATGESLATLEGHGEYMTSVCFSPDGRRLASGSNDDTVHVWDAATGESLATLEGHSGGVTSVCFSPDGRRLASGSNDDTVRVWDAATGESLATLEGHGWSVRSVCFSPDGRRLASGSIDATVRVWDAATGESLATLEGHSGGMTSVWFSPDGRRLASGSLDTTVRVWDAATGESLATLEGHSRSVTSVCYSPDGRRLASGSDDTTVRVWDAATCESLATLEGHSDKVTSVCFSPDGRWLASGSGDQTVRVWDAATGESLATLEGHSDEVTSMCFSPDGRRLASGSDDTTVRVWEELLL